MLVEQTAAEKNLVFIYEDDKLKQDEMACRWFSQIVKLKGFQGTVAYASFPWDYTDMEMGSKFPKGCMASDKKFLEELRRSEYMCFRIHGKYNGQEVIIGMDLRERKVFIVRDLSSTGVQEDLAEALKL